MYYVHIRGHGVYVRPVFRPPTYSAHAKFRLYLYVHQRTHIYVVCNTRYYNEKKQKIMIKKNLRNIYSHKHHTTHVHTFHV